MSKVATLSTLFALCLMAVPAAAQDAGLLRRSFSYFDQTLTVEVESSTPGSLRLLRGGNGRVEVAAASQNALTGAGIGGIHRDRLRLSAVGGSNVDYLVMVPEGVHVRIQLPDQDYALPAAAGPSSTYRWSAPVSNEPLGAMRSGETLYLTHAATNAPTEVSVQDLTSVRRLGVRTGGSEFRLETSRPLSATPGAAERIVIQTVGEAIDILITLPRGTTNFTLRVPEGVAFSLTNGESQLNCGPSTSQILRDGRRAIDITPISGSLQCDGAQ